MIVASLLEYLPLKVAPARRRDVTDVLRTRERVVTARDRALRVSSVAQLERNMKRRRTEYRAFAIAGADA